MWVGSAGPISEGGKPLDATIGAARLCHGLPSGPNHESNLAWHFGLWSCSSSRVLVRMDRSMSNEIRSDRSRWTIEGGKLRIALRELPQSIDARIRLREEEWLERGWLEEGFLVFEPSAWADLGRVPEDPDSPDAQEARRANWVSTLHLVADLLGIADQVVAVELVGTMSAGRARLKIRLNGRSVDLDQAAALAFFSEAPGGEEVFLPPIARALSEARDFTGFDQVNRLRQWAQMRAELEQSAELLGGRVRLEVRGYLDVIDPVLPSRFSLEWHPSGPEGQFRSLVTSALLPDGTVCKLPYENLDPRGIVYTDLKRPILLPGDVGQVAESARHYDLRLAGDVAQEVSDPARVIPEGVDADAWFDLSHYSDRVAGFERLKPMEGAERKSSGLKWFDDGTSGAGRFGEVIIDDLKTGSRVKAALLSRAEAQELLERNADALASGDPAPMAFGEHLVRPSEQLAVHLAGLLHLTPAEPSTEAAAEATRAIHGGRRLAAIIRELDESGAEDASGLRIDDGDVPWDHLQALLAPGVQLKEHQRRGIAWMWAHARHGTPGVVLADDMGLGKTLQVASFLALRNRISEDRSQQLIVCPTVLIDNWREELSRFFEPNAFGPSYVLYGSALRRVKRQDGLDLEFLHQHQLIITNYDTLASYQTSLLKLDFDVIALDEAHNIKNPDTLRSRAARALKRNFAIGMTGTPVENELADIWALYDAVQERQPRAFGTRRAFKEQFGAAEVEAIAQLRQHLRFPSAASPLLRREKREALRDLPPKNYFARSIAMTPEQANQELAIAKAANTTGALKALGSLQKLYQHPVLLTGGHPRISVDTTLALSPKTELCVSILEEIRADHPAEKALVFVISRQMQEVLALLLQQRFGLARVHIINGEPENRRLALRNIADFSRSGGFDVMVLSPLAAGVGLNIVAANHVIHYGRWWNPAKEDQATDRAYRIGQTRPVSVYYPLLHRPGQPEEGFDMRLHELVERKRSIARDFLTPTEGGASEPDILRVLQSGRTVA